MEYFPHIIILLIFVMILILMNIGVMLSKNIKATRDVERALYRLVEITKEKK